MLTGVPEVNQNDLMDIYRFSIDTGTNVLVLGPSGGGKTEMCFSIIKEKHCRPIYINMAVLERTDFQGMPVISDDKLSVSYATPAFLPFADTEVANKKLGLNTLISWLKKQKNVSGALNTEEAITLLEQEIEKINDEEEVKLLKKSLNCLPENNFFNLRNEISSLYSSEAKTDDMPIVILFDEVDKGIQEVLQTLLEFLQFKSINGRKLNIKSCIMTANMPDEFAHSNQISHAITKRGLTFQLKLDFDLWKSWAIKNKISHLIIGFLNQHKDYLYKNANGDDTAYALPSPRTWTMADKVVKEFENSKKYDINKDSDIRLKLISGAVGQSAAIQFNNWHKHYFKLDHHIEALMERGVFPTATNPDLTTEDIFICALSACAKIEAELKPDNTETIEKYIKHSFVWLATLPPDIQVGSIRMVFGGNFDTSKGLEGLIFKYKLSSIPEFTKLFITINENMKKWDELNAKRSEEPSAEQA